MRDNDPITRGDLQTLFDHITSERRSVENYVDNKIEQVNTKVDALQKDVSTLKTDMKRVENKVDVLTDAVIEGFDNTERILSDWEGKPVDIISKQTKDELENTA